MGRKILLADDSITIQKVVNLTFSDEGIEVITVGNGELAVRKMNEVRPDIVLADVYMPGKSGYEVCEFVKTNPQFAHIPVLLLVGAFEPFDPAEAVRVKADGHLTKPFESRALVATVSRLLSSAPPPAIPFSPPAPMAAVPVPQSWHSIPPDATTTKLSPDLAEKFQSSFANEHKKPELFRASPVTPIQASPVTPIQASPVFLDDFSVSNPVVEEVSSQPSQQTVSYTSPASNFVDKVFSFDNNEVNNPVANEISVSASDNEEVEIDRGPVFDLDSPPANEPTFELDLNDISYNTSEQKVAAPTISEMPPVAIANDEKGFDLNEPSFDLNQVNQNQQYTESEDMNLDVQDDQYESTKIMGSASRKELQAAYAAYSSSESEKTDTNEPSQLELDVDLNNDQASTPSYQDSTEIQYDDFTPLDLEPLEEVHYQNAVSQTTGSSHDHVATATDELPAINDEYVFESTTSEIKREPLLDIEDAPSSPTIAYQDASASLPTMAYPPSVIPSYSEPSNYPVYPSDEGLRTGRITGSHDNPRITETMPQLPAPEGFDPGIESRESLDSQDNVLEEPIPEYASSTPNFEIEEPPSQLELEQAPAQYYLENESSYSEYSDEPLADLVTPELDNQPQSYTPSYYQTNYQSSLPTDDVLEETPLEIDEPVASMASTEAINYQAQELEAQAPEIPPTPTIPTPQYIDVPPALPTVKKSDLPTLPSIPALEVESPMVSQPAMSPVAITSIDQIPQHLVDEIVRRVVAQLSENVVREIAWEVVPDLAQIMIKKQLSQTSGK